MRLDECGFTKIYRKYQLFEVDELTDRCQGVEVTNDDCYMLTTTFIDDVGYLKFVVLAIGSSSDASMCTKGLSIDSPLAIIDSEEMVDYPFEFVDVVSVEVLRKAYKVTLPYKSTLELEEVRKIDVLDDSRNLFYPDFVTVSFLEKDNRIASYSVRVQELSARFIEGVLAEKPRKDIGFKMDELVQILPVHVYGTTQLVATSMIKTINKEAVDLIKRFINEFLKKSMDEIDFEKS